MFITNKYSRLYYTIINHDNPERTKGYVESHHIVPRSCGGSDCLDNIVELTAREHYICHYLLTKFSVGLSYYKMVHAFHFLNIAPRHDKRILNSKLYEINKIRRTTEMKRIMSGRKLSEETKDKIRQSALERDLSGSNNPFY